MLYEQIIGQSARGRDIRLLTSFQQPPEPVEVLFIGATHGDEPLSSQLLARFITHLNNQPPQKPVALLPELNPDGLAANTRTNANGVDLNRNFPTKNWVEENKGEIYYSGPSAASEPETRLLTDVIERLKPKKIITVHTPYKVVNWDGPAQKLASVISEKTGYPAVADIGYPTPGSFGTWAGVERQIPTITLELPEDEPLEAIWPGNRDAFLAAIELPV